MADLNPKEFIQQVFIDELQSLIHDHPYVSFIVMGVGTEFLGKCIDKNLTSWTKSGRSKADFETAIKKIPSLKRYEPFLKKYNLYSSFRCGLTHSAAPKHFITLSSKGELGHLREKNNKLNLKVEDFYQDFKDACQFVINDSYPADNKMNTPFLSVPGSSFNAGTYITSAVTSSYNR